MTPFLDGSATIGRTAVDRATLAVREAKVASREAWYTFRPSQSCSSDSIRTGRHIPGPRRVPLSGPGISVPGSAS